jgi:hypothetical protein
MRLDRQAGSDISAAAGFIGSVASHLGHPGFARVACDTDESDAPALQLEREQQDVIGHEATPSQDFDGEEISAGESLGPYGRRATRIASTRGRPG